MTEFVAPTSVLYQFNLSDVAAGYVDRSQLTRELAPVGDVVSIHEEAGTYTLYFLGDPLTSEEEQQIADLVAAHEPKLAESRAGEFSARTRELAFSGFEYPAGSGTRFTLDNSARISLIGAYLLKDHPQMVYPIRWSSTSPGVIYEVSDASDMEGFFFAAFSALRAILEGENALNAQVNAATTIAEMLAVEDVR